MKIYSIKCISDERYDYYDSHIIVAETKEEVVNIAKACSAGEGKNVWKSENVIEIGYYTGDSKRPLILLSSFNAG